MHKKLRESTAKDSWAELAKGILHTTEHHVWYTDWEELAGRCWSLLRHQLGQQGWWAIVLSTFFSGVLLLSLISLLLLLLLSLAVFLFSVSIIKLFLSQPTSFTFCPVLFPTGAGGLGGVCSEQAPALYFSCQLGLSHESTSLIH